MARKGMVHALREVHRVLRPGGVLIDARPDSRVLAYAELRTDRAFRRYAVIRTNRTEHVNDRMSDRALAQVVKEGLFRSRRVGRFWHLVPFRRLAELRQYVRDHARFVHQPEWLVDVSTRRRHAGEPFVVRRAVRYEVLTALQLRG